MLEHWYQPWEEPSRALDMGQLEQGQGQGQHMGHGRLQALGCCHSRMSGTSQTRACSGRSWQLCKAQRQVAVAAWACLFRRLEQLQQALHQVQGLLAPIRQVPVQQVLRQAMRTSHWASTF